MDNVEIRILPRLYRLCAVVHAYDHTLALKWDECGAVAQQLLILFVPLLGSSRLHLAQLLTELVAFVLRLEQTVGDLLDALL